MARRTRILLLADDVPPNVGGVAEYLRMLYADIAPGEVTLVTPRRDPPPDLPGAEVVTYRTPAWMPLHVTALTLAALRAAVRCRARTVHCGSALPASCAGLALHLVLRLPYLVHAYGSDVTIPRGRPFALLLWQALRRAGRVTAVSEFTRAAAIAAGARPERTEVLHPPIDAQRFEPDEPPKPTSGPPTILTVARLVPRKGHDVVLRALALARIEVPDLRYEIVGEGPERAALEALARELGLKDDAVTFHGRVPDVRPHLQSCTAFVMVSRTEPAKNEVEGFGIAFCEASACGRPVVAGRSGGTAEAVVDGVTGLLVDPTDPRAAADAILRLVKDPELAGRLGRQGREHVLRNLDPTLARDRLRAVTAAILSG